MKGTITRLVADKGFGFIKGEDGVDYFMHRSAVQGGQFEELQPGPSSHSTLGGAIKARARRTCG